MSTSAVSTATPPDRSELGTAPRDGQNSAAALNDRSPRQDAHVESIATTVVPFDAQLATNHREAYASWLELFEHDAGAHALQHPDHVLAEPAASVAGTQRPQLVRRGDSGLAVLLPKTIITRKVTGPGLSWTLKGYRLAGNRLMTATDAHAANDDSANNAEPLRGQLFDSVLNVVNRDRADFLLVEDVEVGTPLHRQLVDSETRGCRLYAPKGIQPRLKIRLPDTADAYWAKFSSKTRSTFRRKLKKFGQTRLERIDQAADVPRFLELASKISEQTWQTRLLGLRVRNDEHERRQFVALADRGLLRSYLWYVGDEPAAFLVGNQAHGVFNYEEVGYATAYSRNSPGQMLLIQVLDDLFAHRPPQLFDFGGGDADYKRLFANETGESGTFWVLPNGWRQSSLLAYLRFHAWGKRQARAAIDFLGWTSQLRHSVKFGKKRTPASDGPNTAEPEASERASDLQT